MRTKSIVLLILSFLLVCCTDKKEVTGIVVDKPQLSLYAGETAVLTATVQPEGLTVPIVWRSLREAVASVKDGQVTALSPGMTEIIATAGDFSAGCRLTVLKPPVHVNGVSLSENLVYMQPSDTKTLTAEVSPADADNTAVRWSSSDESVVGVDNGLLTALQEGEADITVTTVEGEFSDICHVIVRTIIPVTGVSFPTNPRPAFIGVPMTLVWKVIPENATDKSVTWSSSDEQVATVTDGTVLGLKEGSVTITVTTVDGGYTASCVVTVIRPEGAIDGGGFESFENRPVEWDTED